MKYSLSSICALTMGQSPDSSTYNVQNIGLPFYQGNADFGKINPNPRIWCSIPKKIAQIDDILISVRAPIGDLNIASEECGIGRGLASIRIKDRNQCDLIYLFHFLESKANYLQEKGTGSTFKAINKDSLLNLVIPLPSMEMQKSISYDLLALHKAIDSKKTLLLSLDELVKSRFIEMFIDKGFSSCPIRDLVNRGIITAKKKHSKDDLIKYIDISSIDNQKNEVIAFTEYKLSDAPSRAQQCLKQNDILISTVRPNLKNIAINRFENDNMVGSSGFCVLRAQNCNPDYLLYTVLTEDFTAKMVALTSGASYPAIRDSDVLDYIAYNPPIELQNEFAEFVKLIDKSKFVYQL